MAIAKKEIDAAVYALVDLTLPKVMETKFDNELLRQTFKEIQESKDLQQIQRVADTITSEIEKLTDKQLETNTIASMSYIEVLDSITNISFRYAGTGLSDRLRNTYKIDIPENIHSTCISVSINTRSIGCTYDYEKLIDKYVLSQYKRPELEKQLREIKKEETTLTTELTPENRSASFIKTHASYLIPFFHKVTRSRIRNTKAKFKGEIKYPLDPGLEKLVRKVAMLKQLGD